MLDNIKKSLCENDTGSAGAGEAMDYMKSGMDLPHPQSDSSDQFTCETQEKNVAAQQAPATPRLKPIRRPRGPATNTLDRERIENHHTGVESQQAPAVWNMNAKSPVREPASHNIAEIQQLWRMRQRWHRAEKSLILQARAVCRAWTNGDKDEANKLFDTVQAGTESDPILQMALSPFLAGIEQFEPQRKLIEKRLKKAAQSLPVWKWVETVKGFGPLNLAAIVGEAGEISNYRSPACLWKRMGLAVIDGGRQRKVSDAERALLHGYNPARRAVAYLLSESLLKVNKAEYRALYDARKAYELAREDDGKPGSLGHAHKRAMRHIGKRALKDLFVQWRKRVNAA